MPEAKAQNQKRAKRQAEARTAPAPTEGQLTHGTAASPRNRSPKPSRSPSRPPSRRGTRASGSTRTTTSAKAFVRPALECPALMPLPKLKDIKWVTTDCYGTLIDWEKGIADAFKKEADRDGLTIDDKALLERFFRSRRGSCPAPTSSTPRSCAVPPSPSPRRSTGRSSPRAPSSCPTASPTGPPSARPTPPSTASGTATRSGSSPTSTTSCSASRAATCAPSSTWS